MGDPDQKVLKDEGLPEARDMNHDLQMAQALAAELLTTAFVCDLGLFGGYPTLRFANNSLGIEIWLSITSGFALSPQPALPKELTPRQKDLLLLESIYGSVVNCVSCYADCRLEIRFASGSTLLLRNEDVEEDEPWTIREEGGSALLVARRGGGFAVWPREDRLTKQSS